MKAALIESWNELVVRDIPMPQIGPYEALCELLYGATCTGTDSSIIAGTFPWIRPLPTVLGHESVGRVVEMGPKVRHLKVGDLITRVGTPGAPEIGVSATWGGFAEFGVAADHRAMAEDGVEPGQWMGRRMQLPLPDGIPATTGPMFITWRETLSYLRRLGVPTGGRVLINGSGGNGLAFAAHAANLGAEEVVVIGSAAFEPNAVGRLGVCCYIDYRGDDLAARVAGIAGEGFDCIIDAVGSVGAADLLLPALKPGGAYGLYGLGSLGAFRIDPTRARGRFRFHPCGDYLEAEAHEEVCRLVLDGKLEPAAWYDSSQCFGLDDIDAAFAAARQRRSPKSLVRLNRD